MRAVRMTFRIHDGDLNEAGAGRLQERIAPVRRGRSGTPSTSQVSGSVPPSALSATGSFSACPFRGRDLDVGVRRRESDMQRLFVARAAGFALLLAEHAQGRRQIRCLSRADDVGGRARRTARDAGRWRRTARKAPEPQRASRQGPAPSWHPARPAQTAIV